MLKYNAATLQRIENLLKEMGYIVRYEKGSFQSGHCVVKAKKVVIMNKFYTTEARIAAFLEMLVGFEAEAETLPEESAAYYAELRAAHEKQKN